MHPLQCSVSVGGLVFTLCLLSSPCLHHTPNYPSNSKASAHVLLQYQTLPWDNTSHLLLGFCICWGSLNPMSCRPHCLVCPTHRLPPSPPALQTGFSSQPGGRGRFKEINTPDNFNPQSHNSSLPITRSTTWYFHSTEQVSAGQLVWARTDLSSVA